MLYIHGGNKEQVKLSKQIFHFCNKSLFSKKEKPTIDLSIKRVEDALAWTDYEGDGKFFIEIEESLDRRTFIITFCHEMIHVKQFMAGVEVSEFSAYYYEEKLANQFYDEELANQFEENIHDINED